MFQSLTLRVFFMPFKEFLVLVDHLIGQIIHGWCPLIQCTLVQPRPGSWQLMDSPVSVHGLVSTGLGAREPETSQPVRVPILPPSDNLIVTNITPAVPSQIDLSETIIKNVVVYFFFRTSFRSLSKLE